MHNAFKSSIIHIRAWCGGEKLGDEVKLGGKSGKKRF
jgi:hypothetical protein